MARVDVSSRIPALVALIALVAAIAIVIAVTTPWQPLGAGGPGPAVAIDIPADFSVAERSAVAAYQGRIVPPVLVAVIAGLAVSLALGLTRLGPALVAAAGAPFGGGWWARAVCGTIALVGVGRLAVLPLDAWAASVRRDAGLLTSTWPEWLLDQARTLALTMLVAVIAGVGLVGLARLLPRWWWAVAAAAAAGLVVAMSLLYPVLVEPAFNRFTPMADGPLRDRLMSLAQRDGVPVSEVLVADASRRTTAVNAYVSGVGPTRRLVVYDTLLRTDDVEQVVAHELGHVKDGDVVHGTLIAAAGAAAAVIAMALLVTWLPLLARLGIPAPADPAVIPLAAAALAVLMLLASPVQMLVSRHIEARADVHALDLLEAPSDYALMQKRLALANLSALDPAPWRYALLVTHPTAPQRIGLARDWARIHGRPDPPPMAGIPVPMPAGGSG